MSLTGQDIETVQRLDDRVHTATSDLYNTHVLASIPDPELGHVFGEVEFTLTDILQVAVLTATHVLLEGETGSAKTDLLKMVAQAAFGEDWFLLRLNPGLDDYTFSDPRPGRLLSGDVESMRECVKPAEFLRNPLLVLDEVNRTPAALTNILLGYLDNRIELKFGIKEDTGYFYQDTDGVERRYNLLLGTMNPNDDLDYSGTFSMDKALARRFTLTVPADECRATSRDRADAIERRTGPAVIPCFDSMISELAPLSHRVAQLEMDDLARIYLLYVVNMDRCPHIHGGYKSPHCCPEVCARSECRIFKIADGFCAHVSGLNLAVAIFLRRAASGLAVLRAARVLNRVAKVCRSVNAPDDPATLNALQQYAGSETVGEALCQAVTDRYLTRLAIIVEDVRSLLPCAAYGGKVYVANDYVAKHFSGRQWQALRRYATESYSWMEAFFRDHCKLFKALADGNGAAERLRERLLHAEKFTDPVIRSVVEPFLERREQRRSPDLVVDELADRLGVRRAAAELASC